MVRVEHCFCNSLIEVAGRIKGHRISHIIDGELRLRIKMMFVGETDRGSGRLIEG